MQAVSAAIRINTIPLDKSGGGGRTQHLYQYLIHSIASNPDNKNFYI